MIKRRTLFYICLSLLAAGIIAFIYIFRGKIGRVLSPFFMAVIIAYLVTPLTKKLQRKNIPKSVSILLIYLFFILLSSAACIYVFPELVKNIRDLSITLPDIVTQYQKMFNDFIMSIRTSNWSDDIKAMLFEEIENGAVAVQKFGSVALKRTLSIFVQALTMLVDFTVALVIAYYFVKDADFFRDNFLVLAPRRWRNGLVAAGKEVNTVLSNFIQGQLLTAFIVGVLETIGLIIIGAKYPVVLGFIGGLSNIIPYFGPYIGVVPAVAVSLLQSPMKAVWTVVVFAVIQQIDNSFISPKVIEGRLGLHPVTTILAVLVGGEFFGIPGMLVAVPVVAICKIIIKRVIEAIV